MGLQGRPAGASGGSSFGTPPAGAADRRRGWSRSPAGAGPLGRAVAHATAAELSGRPQESLEQNVLEVASAVEDREHDDRAGPDPIHEAMGPDDGFPPPANAKEREFGYFS
jgi:hypothetical protein